MLQLEQIHDEHAERVWRNLHRMGVPEADLPDMLQEVFVVVHRRLDSFDGSSKLTTWLFGICKRVASNYRRRAHVRREKPTEQPQDDGHHDTPEAAAIARSRAELLHALLDELDVDRRAVLVMFELEELSCAEIAEQIGVPVGTVYSRLHHARAELKRVWNRKRAQLQRGAA